MIEQVLLLSVVILLITLLYKCLPYRNMGSRKPVVSLFPKYRTRITLNAEDKQAQLEEAMSHHEFTKKSECGGIIKYSRGNLLGDYSVGATGINVYAKKLSVDSIDISTGVSWVVAFDSGDFWNLLAQLREELKARPI